MVTNTRYYAKPTMYNTIYYMSRRRQEHANILAIQQQIDFYSHSWVTEQRLLSYAMYTYYINELVTLKLAIQAHECQYGFNN